MPLNLFFDYISFLLFLSFRNKKEVRSYIEISESVGVDKPSDILFVTDVIQEAAAAKAAGNRLLFLVICSMKCCNGSSAFRYIYIYIVFFFESFVLSIGKEAMYSCFPY